MAQAERTHTSYAPAQVLCIDPGGGRATVAEARARCDAARAVVSSLPTYRAARGHRAAAVDVAGDIVLVALFADDVSIVTCAREFVEKWLAAGQTGHRVGAHVGPVSQAEELGATSTVEGPGASVARAVMECGDVGHVLLSETVVVDAAERASTSVVGRVEVMPGLPLELLSLVEGDVGRAEEPTRAAQLSQARAARLAPLPLPSMPGRFVGRETELSGIADALDEASIVSLVGPAGVGKTRLAIEAAGRSEPGRPHGPWFADLTAVSEPLDVAWAIARAVGLREFGREPTLDRLARYLRPQDGLLVLDACEAVADATVEVVEKLTSECGELSILATSRKPLSYDGARCIRVGGFAAARAPTTVDGTWADSPAVELFERKAYEANRAFRVTDALVDPIAEMCSVADGRPMTIGLIAAATAMETSTPDRTLASASERLGDGSPQGSGIVAWACDRLPRPARHALRRLSAFDGWFGASAADAVNGDVPVHDQLDLLTRRGLLLTDERARMYRLARPVAAYLREGAPDDHASAALLRATYYASPMSSLADAEADEAERALAWSADNNRELSVALATRLSSAWRATGDWERTDRWLSRLLVDRDGVAVDLLAHALTARSRARVELARADEALADAEEALAFASSVDDRQAVAAGRQTQGQALIAVGAIDDGLRRHEQALATLRRLDMRAEEADALADLAAGSLLAGDADRAMACCLEGLRAAAEAPSATAESSLMLLRGMAAAQSGQYTRALDAFSAALAVHRRVGAARHEASNLLWQARLATRASDHHSAALYHGVRVDVLGRVGSTNDIAQALRLAAVAACRGSRLLDARRLAREEARLRAASGNDGEAARALLVKAFAETSAGDTAAARDTLKAVLSEAADNTTQALCVAGLGVAAHGAGALEEAATLLAASDRWWRDSDGEPEEPVAMLYAAAAATARVAVWDAMPGDAYGHAATRGDAMDIQAAADFARGRG